MVRLSNGESVTSATTVIPAAPLPAIVTRPETDAVEFAGGVWAMQREHAKTTLRSPTTCILIWILFLMKIRE